MCGGGADVGGRVRTPWSLVEGGPVFFSGRSGGADRARKKGAPATPALPFFPPVAAYGPRGGMAARSRPPAGRPLAPCGHARPERPGIRVPALPFTREGVDLAAPAGKKPRSGVPAVLGGLGHPLGPAFRPEKTPGHPSPPPFKRLYFEPART